MQTQRYEQAEKFVAQLKLEHLVQSDPTALQRVLVLAVAFFLPEPTIFEADERLVSRRQMGLVPDGIVTGPAHAPLLKGNATAPAFVEPPPEIKTPAGAPLIDAEKSTLTPELPVGGERSPEPLKPFVAYREGEVDPGIDSGPTAPPPSPIDHFTAPVGTLSSSLDAPPNPDGPSVVPVPGETGDAQGQ